MIWLLILCAVCVALGFWMLAEDVWPSPPQEPDGPEDWDDEHGPAFLPEGADHPYLPNKEQPGCCAQWMPTRGGGEQQCLMSKAMHDE